MQEQIFEMVFKFNKSVDRALFIMAYLTGGRISEIVQCPKLKKNNYKWIESVDKFDKPIHRIARNEAGSPIIQSVDRIEHNYLGIKKNDIRFDTIRGKQVMIVTMQNRKNKRLTKKNLPISIKHEHRFVGILKTYINVLGDEEPLFPFGVSKAEKIIERIDMNPHFLRDIRLTHLVTMYHFGAYELKRFAGWTDAKPADRYVQLGVADLVDKY